MQSFPPSRASSLSEKATTKHLENLVHSLQDAVNNRTFHQSTDPSAPKNSPPTIWDHCSPFFHAEFEYAANTSLELEQTLQLYREVAAGYPDFRIKVLDVTTKVDEGRGWATSFANLESLGESCGV